MLHFNRTALLCIILLLIVMFFSVHPWHFFMLTAAQLVFVPLILLKVVKKDSTLYKYYSFLLVFSFFSVSLLQTTASTKWDVLFASTYTLFTLAVALYGIQRFFKRGFAYVEEFAIDAGMIYLLIGGLWHFAYEVDINTGFPPMLTWLTSIHFHYSACLLPIFVGLLGRLHKTKLYRIVCLIILPAPLLLALGITFFPWLEFMSVLFYILGIYALIFLSFKASFGHVLQRWCIRLSFGSLGITIVFSLLYAAGNVLGTPSVSIHFMLYSHGILNCVLFAGCGLLGWCISPPSSKDTGWNFPISQIRGQRLIGDQFLSTYLNKNQELSYSGLVDDMSKYEPGINLQTLSTVIIDFYENTSQYKLYSEVFWHSWFVPFAHIYYLFSRRIQQINLPLSRARAEMTGSILAISDELDGRTNTRAWVRKINNENIFTALYSSHQADQKTYMNIALPLPWSSMIGVLELKQQGEKLLLTSNGDGDSGVFLAMNQYIFKLPLKEQFLIAEAEENHLSAIHRMKIFNIPFLTINYLIHKK